MMQIPEVKEKGKLSFYFSKNPDVVSMKYVNSRSERNGKVARLDVLLQTMYCHICCLGSFFRQHRPVAYWKLEIGIIVMGKRKEEENDEDLFL